MSTSPLPQIKIGTLAERLAASAAVPLDQAIAGVRAHGPQPTREPPEVAALKYFRSLKRNASSQASSSSSTEKEQSMMSALIPKQAV